MRTLTSPLLRFGFALSSIGALALLTPLASARGQGAKPVFVDGQAQVVPAFSVAAEWIRQRLWVETEFDSDNDGKRDRVHIDVTRPRQTKAEGLKVPVIYESSPYFAGTAGGRSIFWDVNHEVGAEPPSRSSHPEVPVNATRTSISNSQVGTWVPRGFAVVHSEAPGTGLSGGCPTVGGAPERLAPKAVIDWLNGRAKGFTTPDGREEILVTWCTGKVGMTGTSYNGTLPVAAATTGVKGLEAIIPIAPNTSYYHYYRSNGLVRHPGGWLGEDIESLYDFINSGVRGRRYQEREECSPKIRRSRVGAFRGRNGPGPVGPDGDRGLYGLSLRIPNSDKEEKGESGVFEHQRLMLLFSSNQDSW